MKLIEILTEDFLTSKQTKLLFQQVAATNYKQLMQAWQQAGSPTDLNNIRKFLSNMKISSQVIAQAMQTIGVGASTQPPQQPLTIQKTFDPRAEKMKQQTPQPGVRPKPKIDVMAKKGPTGIQSYTNLWK